MKKTIKRNGREVVITVSLNSHGEKHIDGSRFHNVKVKGVNCDYSEEYNLDTSWNLEDHLMIIERDFIDFADKANKEITTRQSLWEKTLEDIGYTK